MLLLLTALTLREQCWDSSLLSYLLRDSSVGSWWILMQYLQLMTGKCWPHISSWQIHQFNDKYSRETALQSWQHKSFFFRKKSPKKIIFLLKMVTIFTCNDFIFRSSSLVTPVQLHNANAGQWSHHQQNRFDQFLRKWNSSTWQDRESSRGHHLLKIRVETAAAGTRDGVHQELWSAADRKQFSRATWQLWPRHRDSPHDWLHFRFRCPSVRGELISWNIQTNEQNFAP